MADDKLIGKNYQPPDIVAKITGVAEAAVGAGAAAVRCALAAAVGDEYVRRTPVGIDMNLASGESGKRVDQGADGKRVSTFRASTSLPCSDPAESIS